ncbi:uncharacterized protein [Argopecten irradians]|uniref:uncharacterized protein isoform X2 n=1 Tax=Argopecten irradians TaxID=31199 RepID=UPI0037212D10
MGMGCFRICGKTIERDEDTTHLSNREHPTTVKSTIESKKLRSAQVMTLAYDPTVSKRKLRAYVERIANLESDREDLVNLKVRNERTFALELVEKDINFQREKFLSAINNIADSFLVSYRKNVDATRNAFDNNLQRMQCHIDSARRRKDKIKATLKQFGNKSVLDMADIILDDDDGDEEDDDDGDVVEVPPVTFIPGMIDVLQLEELFGCLTSQTTGHTGKRPDDTPVVNRESVSSVEVSSDCLDSLHHKKMPRSIEQDSDIHQGSASVTLHQTESCAKLISSFSCSAHAFAKSYAHEILPIKKRSCWINLIDKKKLKEIDINGEIKETFRHDLNVCGACVTPGEPDSMLLCCQDDMSIKQLTSVRGKTGFERRMIDFLSTKPLYPRCACRYKDEVHVTLVDDTDLKPTRNSIRCVVTYKNKTETNRVEKDAFGDAIFVQPSRVKINKKGDTLAVINRTDKGNSHLVLLNKNLTVKLRYLGDKLQIRHNERFNSLMYTPASPYAITDVEYFDEDCLIVSEQYSRCVELLSDDCQRLLTIVPQEAAMPYSIALYAGTLWVGYFDAQVKVYEIKVED